MMGDLFNIMVTGKDWKIIMNNFDRANKNIYISAVAGLVMLTNIQMSAFGYSSIYEAIDDSAKNREYLLFENENISSNLGQMKSSNSTLSVNGGEITKYGVKSTNNNSGFVVNGGNSLILQNIGKAQVNIETGEVTYSSGNGLEGFVSNSGSVVNNSGNLKIQDVVFYGNKGNNSNFGGVIYNNKNISSISGKFLNNQYGSGVVANYGNNAVIDYIEADFIGNKQGRHGGAIINVNGGKITKINNSNFIMNSAVASGGAIRNLNDGNFFEVNNSLFRYNSAKQGGAIHNGGTSVARINSSVFDKNYSLKIEDKNWGGGAIYSDGKTYVTDSDFTNNATEFKGGAIFSEGVLEINAKERDVLFDNNKQNVKISGSGSGFVANGGTYNDLYLTKSVQINANADKNITFNGSVESKDINTVISLNGNSEIKGGNYVFNNTIKNGTLLLNDNANLKLGHHTQQDGSISSGKLEVNQLEVNNGAYIDTRDKQIGEVQNFGKLVLNSDLSVAIDADLANKQVDKFSASDIISNGNNIVIDSIHLLSGVVDNAQIVFTDNNKFKNIYTLSDNILSNITKEATVKGSYTVKYSDFGAWSNDGTNSGLSDSKGILVFDKVIVNDLARNVHLDEDFKLYGLDKDELVEDDLGALHGKSLGIAGNNHAINGTTDGVQYEGIVLKSNQNLSVSNVSSYNGFDKAIVNQNSVLNITNTVFENNTTADIDNSGVMNLSGVNSFEKITDTNNSGAMHITDGTTTIKKSFVQNVLNIKDEGTLVDNGTSTINGGNNRGTIVGNGSLTNNGEFINDGSVNLVNGIINNDEFTNNGTVNNFTNNPGAKLTTSASNISGNITNDGNIDLIGGTLTTNIDGYGKTNINADTEINSKIINNDLYLNSNAELSLGLNGLIDEAKSFVVNAGALNLQDERITNTNLGNLILNSDLNLKIDGDFVNKNLDTIVVKSIINNGNKINITSINVLTPTTQKSFSISPIGEMSNTAIKTDLANTIQYVGGDIAMTPIYKYQTTYDNNTGMLNFSRSGGTPTYEDFNPAILTTPIMSQVGLQATLNSTTHFAFHHADEFTKLRATDRFIALNSRKYALSEQNNGGFSSTEFNQNLNTYNELYDNKGFWVRPYATFENVPLKNGPKVGANYYGTLIGFDSDFRRLRNGWNTIFSGYVGYNGAYLTYNNTSTTMNGGIIGATQTWYKGNFWTAITATSGATVSDNNTMYGHDNTTSILAGVGSKTGYNLEFKDGKFIIQPIMFLSGNFLKTFDYKNSAGVEIDSDPMFAIQINPSMRFIANLKHGWQPYASVGMIWNIVEGNSTRANGEKLPEMSVKPFVEYGLGVQKRIGNRFIGFIQAMMHNGGRNGIALTGGFRWAIGREYSRNDYRRKEKEKVMDKTTIKKIAI